MNEREKKTRKALKRAEVQLLIDYPFFGVLATQLEMEPFESPPHTAGLGVDGKRLYFDPGKILELSERVLQGSLAHETLHCSLGHVWRREDRNRMKWNIATDYAVNSIVLGSANASGTRSLELPEGALYDEGYEDASAEEIYERLPSPQCPRCGSTGISRVNYESEPIDRGRHRARASFRCKACGREWSEEKTVNGGSPGDFPLPFEESDRESSGTIDDHSKWRDAEGGGASGEESANGIEEKWKRWTVRAAQQAKSQGSLPDGVERLVEDLLYPKLNWRNLLNRYVTRQRGSRFDWKRPDRRWIQRGVYYPTKRERKLNAAVAIDTSGSITDDELGDFLSELRGILSSFRSFRVRMFAADADVHAEITAEDLQDFEGFRVEIEGGGGTDYRPVFERLEGDDVEVLIYLGDMEATFPDRAPRHDVVWVVSEEGDPEKPPFGEVVAMG